MILFLSLLCILFCSLIDYKTFLSSIVVFQCSLHFVLSHYVNLFISFLFFILFPCVIIMIVISGPFPKGDTRSVVRPCVHSSGIRLGSRFDLRRLGPKSRGVPGPYGVVVRPGLIRVGGVVGLC